jgi:hypothetical protein
MATTGEPLFEEDSAAINEFTIRYLSPESLWATRTASPKCQGLTVAMLGKCQSQWLLASDSLVK